MMLNEPSKTRVYLELTVCEAHALYTLLNRLLPYVFCGAGVDAWLGDHLDSNLLLAPDEPAAAELRGILDRLT